ncbi:MAG: sigma-70 family RNA polymerase sigma factor [Pirellulales bacterium]|nr:sigma-70 family RNA polymerase sigma factor [Pirellulales bacterium]
MTADQSQTVPMPSDEHFHRLVMDHQCALVRYIAAMVPNSADADEVLQETNLAIWENAHDFEPGSNFRAWAFRIAYHRVLRCRDQKRRETKMFGGELIALLTDQIEASTPVLDARSHALAFCMRRLAPSDRSLLARYYQPGVRAADIARQLHKPVNSIFKTVCRIRKALMQCIERRMSAEEHT